MMDTCIDYSEQVETLLKEVIVSDTDREILKTFGTIKELKKGELFLEKFAPSNKFGFIIKGSIYSYDIDKSGEKRVTGFYFPPNKNTLIDYQSYINEEAISQWYECFEDTVMISFSNVRFNELLAKAPNLIVVRVKFAEERYFDSLNTIKLLQAKNAADKVKELMQQSPNIFKIFPYSYIASYLGMHRNTYRRILARIT
ncbi:Crp/Fnr family transcriptional regulator [Zunongwangia pacifica]|uniref:CRP-like cAMP-binding protein n=1 Tax=Zunongwangia pacifica TaxID=2911062 RepID=A0A9X1ZSQ8_9FLAO|nr:hypothetical protein [Zunongwangia pacifica]MCL6220347.1 hypothetical protein [Zunongwangia pacifica]